MLAILREVKATSLEQKGLLDEDTFVSIAQGVLARERAAV